MAKLQFPEGAARLADVQKLKELPEQMLEPSNKIDPLLLFATATSKNWEDPAALENVICLPSDPAIYGSIMDIVANPNLVYEEYCGTAEQLERAVVRQVATLAGYDPEIATGVFTQGGHYSNTTNLSVLGVDIKNKSIRIQLTANNDMDMADLENQLTACFRLNCVVPTIMLTMGTTDTFGVDRVKPVYDLLSRLCDRFDIPVRPHIHVDAAVGWPLIFFLDYDFDINPLEINSTTLPLYKALSVTFNVSKNRATPTHSLSISKNGDTFPTPRL